MTSRSLRFLLATIAAAGVIGLAAGASAQSGADPTGAAVIGVVEKKDAKGPSLSGVIFVEFLNSDGFTAEGARVLARLRRGSQLEAFYTEIPDTVIFDAATPSLTQQILLDALHDPVLGRFFPDTCDPDGSLCSDVEIVLKRAEEFVVTDDLPFGGTSQLVMGNIVVSSTEPL